MSQDSRVGMPPKKTKRKNDIDSDEDMGTNEETEGTQHSAPCAKHLHRTIKKPKLDKRQTKEDSANPNPNDVEIETRNPPTRDEGKGEVTMIDKSMNSQYWAKKLESDTSAVRPPLETVTVRGEWQPFKGMVDEDCTNMSGQEQWWKFLKFQGTQSSLRRSQWPTDAS